MQDSNIAVRVLTQPYTIILSVVVGVLIGQFFPSIALSLKPLADVFINLLKMISIPLMISAVTFSISRLFDKGGSNELIFKLLSVFVLSISTVVALTLCVSLIMSPGSTVDREALGSIIQTEGLQQQAESITLFSDEKAVKPDTVSDIVNDLVTSNIFTSLTEGNALAILIFTIIFGSALGTLSRELKDPLTTAFESVYRSCLKLTQWFLVPLPFALVAAVSSQLADSGYETLLVMGEFLATFTVASVVVLTLSVAVLWFRAPLGLFSVLQAVSAPTMLAFATRSAVASLPAMMEGLERLKFGKLQVELVTPLSVVLVRFGPIMFYFVAGIFIAELYDRQLSAFDLILISVASVMAGLASAGATGIANVQMIAIVCGYLKLPLEAVIVLFIAVDVISDTLRTILLVVVNMAYTAVICPVENDEESVKPNAVEANATQN